MIRFILDDNDFSDLVSILEVSYEEDHGITVASGDVNSEEYVSAERRMRTARRLLVKQCEDHPFKSIKVKAGKPFDWNAFWGRGGPDPITAPIDELSRVAG